MEQDVIGKLLPAPVMRVDIKRKMEARDRWDSLFKRGTVADRIAQTVVKLIVEPLVEPVFHENSYGYRPNRSAHDALAVARKRCWRRNWVIDLDIKGFFDNLDHDLMMRAVEHHIKEPWVLLYIKRCCKLQLRAKVIKLREPKERHRAELSAHCWLTCSCIMHLIGG